MVSNIYTTDNRLKIMNLYSISRRFERYRVLYSYKIINNLTQNCGLSWRQDDNNGSLLNLLKCKKYETHNRMQSFHYMGLRLYNALPKNMRTIGKPYQDWKAELDEFLSLVPDCAVTVSNKSGLCDQFTARQTNSLMNWIPHLGLSSRR